MTIRMQRPPYRLCIQSYRRGMTLLLVGKEVSNMKLSVFYRWSHGESNPDLSLAKAPFYR